MVKNMPAMQETRVQSLDQEDPLEKKMATHSSILVWEIPWTEEPGGLQSMGLQKSWTPLSDFTFTFHLQFMKCLANLGKYIYLTLWNKWASLSLVAQTVKNLPVMRETQV